MPADLAAWLLTATLAAGAESAASDAPDAEILEFLGAFETKDGQWLDPLALDGNDSTEVAREPTSRKEKQP